MQPTPSRRQWLSAIAASIAAWCCPRKTKAAEPPRTVFKEPVTFECAMFHSPRVVTYTYDASYRLISIQEPVTTYTYDASVPLASTQGWVTTYTYEARTRYDHG